MKQRETARHQELAEEAVRFIESCYRELGRAERQTAARAAEVRASIARTGTYAHTSEELAHGAKMAWRNSNRCIGRLFWETLHVIDERGVADSDGMAEAICRHMAYATNEGRVRPAITIFAPADADGAGPRIWNAQLVRYAGYEREDGTVLGDPVSAALTKRCEAMGWRGAGTAFDVLPLILQAGGGAPKLYEMPRELVLEVPLRHPDFPAFGELGLKWYAVPFVSNMRLEIGGLSYTAAPFNGWYMGTEIGARNLADGFRYNLLPRMAELMGLDTRSEATLWRDKALVELNAAVLHSYKERGVSIVDHHTAAKQFARFEEQEAQKGRDVTGRWSWLIPPLSPATTHVFHGRYDATERTPNYFAQDEWV
ncbi:nitric oxide synthase oxygenase [Paenibacillus methanolicus]|uniref:Nitric oxide synthase oxygenase n=1 Tax=Paenibacillus methanolicus TaxID=582686 RepID=A0A5S5CAX7_9BACL|nr:nitric oxide synthase oxygenase [Paenibacillus methanolicus]TYP75516.1 nitric-oxide synthase [Paenibacillus methanolicus]